MKPKPMSRDSSGRGLAAIIFPEEPREFPARRWVKMVLRAAHVLGAGVLCGSYLLGATDDQRMPWLLAAAISGLLILLLDLHESGAFLLQVRGLVVLAKIGILAALPYLGPYAGWVLAGVVMVSVVSSHASSKVRYFVVLGGGGIRGAETKG
jgi:hypothetical protein